MFKERKSVEEVEEGKYLSPKFDEKGLIPVITTDYQTKEILMHGYMNAEALKKNYYYKRSSLLEQIKTSYLAQRKSKWICSKSKIYSN